MYFFNFCKQLYGKYNYKKFIMSIMFFNHKIENENMSGYLAIYYLVLVILIAGQSLLVQHLAGLNFTGFIVMDLAFATILAIACNRRILQAIAVLQFFFSVFCVSYASAMGMPPTLRAILNGVGYLEVLSFKSIASYINVQWSIVFTLFLLIQCVIANQVRPSLYASAQVLKYKKFVLMVATIVFMITHVNAYISQPFYHIAPNFAGYGDRFEPAQRRSLKYRAFLSTFLLELCSGSAFAPAEKAKPCDYDPIVEDIPLPPDFKNIVFIQVESLDAELLDMEIENQQVMPFLHSLLEHSILVYADGTKKLGSANSDYEIFNGVNALADVLHYEHETSYPRSFLPCLAKKGRKMEAFHGLASEYMNLKSAYKLQGFHKFYDLSEMRDDGVLPLPIFARGTIKDEDLFCYAARHLPQSNFLQFIITMNMHFPEHLNLLNHEQLFQSSQRSAFLSLARSTDNSIKKYVEALPDETLVAIWGDHRSYDLKNSGKIPFLFYVKGKSGYFDGRHIQGLERCTMYYYFQKMFGCDRSENSLCTKNMIN